MNHKNIVLFRQGHDAFEERQVDALSRGIAGKAEYHHLGLGNRLAHGALQFLEEIDARRHAHRANIRPGDHGAINMNGVTGIGHQHRIAPIQGGHIKCAKPSLEPMVTMASESGSNSTA